MSKPTERQITNLGVQTLVSMESDEGVTKGHNDATQDSSLFEHEELSGIVVLKRGEDFIDIECGCTNRKYGDYVGKLKICNTGSLEISCACHSDCKAEKLSPRQFEKHAGMRGTSRWKTHIWVFVDGNKIPLAKTKLLRYYEGSPYDLEANPKPRPPPFHRDEFIECVKCHKTRRFELRNEYQCFEYHTADLARDEWDCSKFPFAKLECDMKDEREASKILRGCPRHKKCNGCTRCVCFGCTMCRFTDCSCRICQDFSLNNAQTAHQGASQH